MEEKNLLKQLGVPDDAEQVIIFAESSHWDPNWLHTSEEYYERFVARNLDAATDALLEESRRIYSVECIFFLRMYWDRNPDKQDIIRRLVNQGRLRLTSSGVTTADTLLPKPEAILRDLLIGQEWVRHNGMTQHPRLAYFTDSFGCSPGLPSLLQAAGFDRTAITRIDGMYFQGSDWERSKNFPRPGSSAAHLLETEKSLDFVWRDRNGAEVLCHWNAFTYFQGDMLAHRGLMRAYFFPLAVPDRSERNVAGKIKRYVEQLSAASRTRYLFCPIGMDFVGPVPDLVALLDRYNRIRFPDTGIWAVNAALDNYLTLVDCHREELPVVALDPNPYWTGFYTARPALKKNCHDLVERLLLAERLALIPERSDTPDAVLSEMEDAWWAAVVANHHDFITGTSPDDVVYGEQLPSLTHAMRLADNAVEQLTPVAMDVSFSKERNSGFSGLPEWEKTNGVVRIQTAHYIVEFSEASGGAILHAWGTHPEDRMFLNGISNELISYDDSGGTYRLGHEYRGGRLKSVATARQRPSELHIRERDEGLELTCDVDLDGETIRRVLWFRADSPLICARVHGRAARERTVTIAFSTDLGSSHLVMAQPGSIVERPREKLYRPTFWPMQEFAHVQSPSDGRGLAFFVNAPGAIALRENGMIELVALRNATRERAYGLVPLLANPVTGYEREQVWFDYGILFTPGGDWHANRLAGFARELERCPWVSGQDAALRQVAGSVVQVEGQGSTSPQVAIIAAKPASRGEGIIVRLSAYAVPHERLAIALRERTVRAAFLCDARERDLEPLTVEKGRAVLTMPGALATVRLLL